MSQGLVERQNLEDIADAIRSKNGSSDTYTPAEMAQAISEIQTADEFVLVQKTVNANGQYNASDDSADGYSGVRVNVPNSYGASDEGKVVSNGDLVAQTSLNVTANGTYDTTENNEVVVDVSGGGVVQTIPNIFINSGLRIFNGWINGFSSGGNFFEAVEKNDDNNYVHIKWNEPFEICIVFDVTQIISSQMTLFGSPNGKYYYMPSIEISTQNNIVWCGFSTDGSTWTDSFSFDSNDGISFQTSTKYTIKAEWDGETYTVSVNDGDNEIKKSITPNAPHYYSSSYSILEFGGIMSNSNLSPYNIRMYLPEMYMKQNGVKLWG